MKIKDNRDGNLPPSINLVSRVQWEHLQNITDSSGRLIGTAPQRMKGITED